MSDRSLVCALLLLFAALPAASAAAPKAAEDKSTVEAREHVNKAKVHFKLQEWDEAVREWKEAYRLKPVPLLLFNIAQASRIAGHYKQSKLYYENFLRDMPDAPNREECRKQLTQLEELLAREGDEAGMKPEPKDATKPAKPPEAKVAAAEPARPPEPPPAAEPPKPPAPEAAVQPEAQTPAVPRESGHTPVVTYALGAVAGALAIAGAVEYGRARSGWSSAVASERSRPEMDRLIADADSQWSVSLGLGVAALAAGAGAAVTFAF